MDGVSAGFPEWDTSAADVGGTGGNMGNDHNTPPGGIRHSRQYVDTEESVRIYLEKVSEKDIRRQCVGVYAALGIDVPTSGQTRPETRSFPYLKVAGGGILSHRPADQGVKCCDLLGRRDRDRQLLELRARICTQRIASYSASGDEKRTAEYASCPKQVGISSLYAV